MSPIYLNSVNCTEFVQSILRKIVKIVVTRCHILRHQIRFRLWLCLRPRCGNLQRSPCLLADFRGLTKGRRGVKEGEREEGRDNLPRLPTVERDRRLCTFSVQMNKKKIQQELAAWNYTKWLSDQWQLLHESGAPKKSGALGCSLVSLVLNPALGLWEKERFWQTMYQYIYLI